MGKQRLFSAMQELFENSEFLPRGMIEDLQAVAQIPDERIDQLVVELDAFPGILEPGRLAEVTSNVVGDEDVAASIARTLQNIKPNAISGTIEFLADWRNLRPENAARLSEDTLQQLRAKLHRFIRPYSAIERYRKARRLATLIGPVAQRIEIICDCRPVFNEARDQVEAFTPLSTLRIVFEDETDDAKAFEVLIPSTMLEDLVSKAQQAQRKLAVLRESVAQWIPNGLADVL